MACEVYGSRSLCNVSLYIYAQCVRMLIAKIEGIGASFDRTSQNCHLNGTRQRIKG
jgi:hypothetical protein